MTDIEQSVVGFVAEETGYNPKRLALDSRLAHDIGVDGDDAVELFQKFEKRYEVDLTSLYEHWDQHFGPEGGGPGMGFMIATGPP
jgi:acyl carrier protein